jgi:hypothetical protein
MTLSASTPPPKFPPVSDESIATYKRTFGMVARCIR